MRDHQKYFAVEDASGKLAPHFLTVTQHRADDGTNAVIIKHGNERVLRARFNDARFFWEFDQRTPLQERVKLLENVTFQKDLGSYAAKTERVRALAAKLAAYAAQNGASVDVAALDEAAQLSKTDLTTELVKEFTELQGQIGGLYAKAQGVSSLAADAIYDQYTPAGMEDGVPRSSEGAILGIADRADTIAGMFSLGMEPTGSKDPFALRRAANGIVKILAETDIPMLLSPICEYAGAKGETYERMRAFFTERVSFYLKDVRGFAQDVVLAVSGGHLPTLVAKAEAITSMRGSEDFLAVSAAFKRMKNILAQANFPHTVASDYDNVGEPVETALYEKFKAVNAAVGKAAADRDFRRAMEAVATLRPEVDAFFEGVMVNDPSETVRQRRLTLLATIFGTFSAIADFSEIVVAG